MLKTIYLDSLKSRGLKIGDKIITKDNRRIFILSTKKALLKDNCSMFKLINHPKIEDIKFIASYKEINGYVANFELVEDFLEGKLGLNYYYEIIDDRKERFIYEVEHCENGKKYDFRYRNIEYNAFRVGNIVICDTKLGHTYGKIVVIRKVKMSDEEYFKLKSIVKIVQC